MVTNDAASPRQKYQSWDPELYRQRASFVHRSATDLVDLLGAQAGEHVLDLGCGTGELTAQIAASGATVLGLDRSRAMVDEAKRRLPNLAFELGDGQDLRFRGQFDAVFSNAALHWMPQADAVLRGVARALRPGGRFVAEFGGRGCIQTVCDAARDALVRAGEDPALWIRWYFPDVAEYVALLASAGFEVRLAHQFERPTPLEGDDGLATWLRTFLGSLHEHLGVRWDAFSRSVEAACRPTLWTAAAPAPPRWSLDYVRLRVVCRLRP